MIGTYKFNSVVGVFGFSLALFLVLVTASPILAAPQGMTVVHGSASASQNGSQLTVTASQNAFLNWQSFNIGAGEMQLDLTGARKNNLDVEVQGGVGSATIALPKDVGVKVHASGGIGAVSTDGLTKQDDDYINSAYGKTPATITVDIQGGVGAISLLQR